MFDKEDKTKDMLYLFALALDTAAKKQAANNGGTDNDAEQQAAPGAPEAPGREQ